MPETLPATTHWACYWKYARGKHNTMSILCVQVNERSQMAARLSAVYNSVGIGSILNCSSKQVLGSGCATWSVGERNMRWTSFFARMLGCAERNFPKTNKQPVLTSKTDHCAVFDLATKAGLLDRKVSGHWVKWEQVLPIGGHPTFWVA